MNKKDQASRFASLLRENEVSTYHEEDIWAYPNYAHQIISNYGWKIHISAILTNAVQIATKFFELNHKYHFDFKILSSIPYLEQINMGYLGNSQVGKFITIYPKQNKATETLELLYYYFHDDIGIQVGSDISYKLSSNVYYRYGTLLDDTKHIDKRDKTLIPPSTAESIYDYSIKRYNSIPNRYLILKPIKQVGPSGIFVALDLHTRMKVIIRYAIKYYNIESSGIDELDRLLSASDLLRASCIQSSNFFEEVIDTFYVNNSLFLVTKFISGIDLDQLAKNGQLSSYSLSKRISIFKNVFNAISILNQNQIFFRDLSFSNIILYPNDKIKIVDFGYATSSSGLANFAGLELTPAGTYGFYDPNMQLDLKQLDFYSLGQFLYYLTFPQAYLDYTSKLSYTTTYSQIQQAISESMNYQLPEKLDKIYKALRQGKRVSRSDLRDL